MDDGYMVGPREVVFKVLTEFAKGIGEGTGCKLVARKCRIQSGRDNVAILQAKRPHP